MWPWGLAAAIVLAFGLLGGVIMLLLGPSPERVDRRTAREKEIDELI